MLLFCQPARLSSGQYDKAIAQPLQAKLALRTSGVVLIRNRCDRPIGCHLPGDGKREPE
ncbi:MAG: hypothetical protein KME45_07455 [Stenomitos rutilans HA7619-LM2]|nr:hypothetical protein [Stenomitos rutilans HA7619-LM2]